VFLKIIECLNVIFLLQYVGSLVEVSLRLLHIVHRYHGLVVLASLHRLISGRVSLCLLGDELLQHGLQLGDLLQSLWVGHHTTLQAQSARIVHQLLQLLFQINLEL